MIVLRMIKLFGWQVKVEEQIDDKREQELAAIMQKKLYGLINANVKCDSC